MTIQSISNRLIHVLLKLQRSVIIIALLAFFTSLVIFYATDLNLISLPQRFTPPSFLSTLAVPLSILLIYELLILVKATTGSFIMFIIAQFEVISLILLRDLFKRIDELQRSYTADLLLDIAIVAIGSIVIYFMVEILERISKHFVQGELKEEIPGKETKRMQRFKSFLEVGLLTFLAVVVAYEIAGFIMGVPGTGLDSRFMQLIFSGLIVYSITQLLLVLIVNERYETLFEHSAMVLASVIVLATLEAPIYVRVPLVIGALGFIIITLFLHGFARGKRFGTMLEAVQKNTK